MMPVLPMMLYARCAKDILNVARAEYWAAVFVELRIEFTRLYSRGICSTSHGIEFFDNVLAGPANWKEPGEYGNNFRKLAENP
jgi:hypothetical protein